MKKNLLRLTLTLSVFLSTTIAAYSQKKLLVLGSSTSACWGPSVPANCYLNRFLNHHSLNGQPIAIDNRAVGGFNVYKSMPATFKAPAGRDAPVPYYTITDAVAANPDVILINYPSNNYDIYSVAEVMYCLRTIKAEANKAGKPCYITTTQPRTGFDAAGREKLRILKDSILQQFGQTAVDFWTGLADPASLAIAAPYQVPGDAIHLNDEAHNVLFQRLLAKNIFTPLFADAGTDLNITLPYGGFLDGRNSGAAFGMVSYLWTKVAGPDSYNITSPTASTTYLNTLTAGVYTFRLTVKDTRGVTASDDVIVTVKADVNATPPVAQAGPDITIILPASSVTLDGSKSTAPSGTFSKVVWTYVSGPTSYHIVTPIAISTTVNSLVEGVYTFRLTVTNTSGLSSADDVVITVKKAAVAPIANAGKDETIPVGQATVLRGKASSAPGGYITSYAWTKVSGPAALEMLSPNNDTTWIRNMTAGVYVFQLTITDNNGNKATDEVVITVTAPVSAPPPGLVANAGQDESIPVGQATVLRGVKSYTTSGYITHYSWIKFSGPAALEMLSPNSDTTWIRNMTEGVYVFRLTITDNAGNKATDEVVITVTGAQPAPLPASLIADAGKDQSIPQGQATLLNGEKSSAPAGIRSYLWTKVSGPSGYEMLTPGASSTWVRNLTPGTYVFRLTVTDNNGLSVFDEVTINVVAVPLPTAVAGPDLQVTLPVSSIVLDGRKSTTPSGYITRYYWKYVAGPLGYQILSPDSAVTKITNLVQGVYTFRLMVINNFGGMSTDDITVSANSQTTLTPIFSTVANAGKDETIPVGQATTLHGENSIAPSGWITSYKWIKYSGPASYEILSPTTATTWIRNMTAGTYVYRLIITDDKGNQAIDDVTITVTPISLSMMVKHHRNPLDMLFRSTARDEAAFRIYPNPAVGQVTIAFSNSSRGQGKLFISDSRGRIVSVTPFFKDRQEFSRQLPLNGLAPGMYTIELSMGRERRTAGKFYKQ